nr:DDE-type integrase/transposase/recombinase [Frankia sp. Cas4]
MTFAAIADWAASDEFPVAFMCTELAMSRSGYYAWRRGEPSHRSRDDTTYTAPIRKIYREGRGNPGGSDRPVPAPDLYSRAVVGWATADHMRTSLVTKALDMAIARRRPPSGVIFHSDRGAQYTSITFDAYCTKNNIRRSLGRTGIGYDCAVSESFFATYKKELIHTRP